MTFPFSWPFPTESRSASRSLLPGWFGVFRRHEQSGIAGLLALDECPHRVCIAFDIVGFGSRCRDDDMQVFVHCGLYHVLEVAFERAGVPWLPSHREDRGDGVLVIVPEGTSPAVLLGPLVAELTVCLRQYNKLVADAVQIRLRMAVHSGPVYTDANGKVGRCLVHLFRMLEAPPFKHAVAASGVHLGVVTSEQVYRDVIESAADVRGLGVYRPIEVVLKETRSPAWMCVSDDDPRPTALNGLVPA